MSLSGLYRNSTFLSISPMGPYSWTRDIPQDPITIAIVISSAVGATTVVAGALAFSWTMFAVNLAMGYALSALSPSPEMPTATAGGGQYSSVNALTSAGSTTILYGETRMGGVVFYQETTNDNLYLHRLIALVGHEVNAITTVYLNDEALTLDGGGNVTSPSKYSGRVRIIKHLGADDQTADANLVSESALWTSNHRARGIAYIYARFEYDADSFPNGVPTVTAIVQGKKIYDPRTSTTAYSNNPSLCLRDYLLASNVSTASEIDEALFSTAANICDENVSLAAGGTQKRYTTSGAFNSDIKPSDAISILLSSMGGMIWYSQGTWGCKAASYTAPVLSLNEDDLRSNIQVKTRNSRRDGFNKISGIFRGPECNYFDTNYPTLAPSTFLSVDNNQPSEFQLNLPLTDTSSMAQRISKIALYRNREQLKITGSFGMRAYQLTVGDLVTLSNTRLGFSNKVFEVTDWKFGISTDLNMFIEMTMQEISSTVFDWNADESIFESNNTTLLSPFAVPAVSIALSQEYKIINEHITNVLVVDVSSPNAERVDAVEVQFKKSTDAEYSSLGFGDLGRFELLDIETPLAGDLTTITYQVKARALNAIGVKGVFATASKIVEADTVGPDAPSLLTKQLSAGTVFFNWQASTALDLSHYKLWHSSNTSATWNDGSVLEIIEKIARPATSITYPALSGTFFLEPYDKSGNAGNTASIVVLPAELPQLGATLTDTENPTFAGTNTNTIVLSSELIMSSYSSALATGTYEFTGYLDTLSPRTARVSDELTVRRKHANATAGSVNWDDISVVYNWDTWPDSWDSWTDEDANFGDFNVATYVSSTNDDPAGSPTWSGWTIASGEKTGRAFKFKVVLSNISNNVTPAISVLKGILEY
jgi:hypothetical protein